MSHLHGFLLVTPYGSPIFSDDREAIVKLRDEKVAAGIPCELREVTKETLESEETEVVIP